LLKKFLIFDCQQPRGNDIFGIAGTGTDNIPYMTLSYANGMGYYNHINSVEGGRVNPNSIDRSANNFRFPATVPRDFETHGGEDVGIWAVGPWAHLYQGTVEQNVIPHVMAYASCIGTGLTMCQE
jgi:alkaline phosphatase